MKMEYLTVLPYINLNAYWPLDVNCQLFREDDSLNLDTEVIKTSPLQQTS